MSYAWRKLGLAIHVNASVGWIGAVAAFAVVAFAGGASASADGGRAAAGAMDIIGWYAIVPLAAVSIASGVVQSLGTSWGLVRHYWIVVKLAATAAATVLLLVHMRLVDRLAAGAAGDPMLVALRHQLQFDAAAGFAVLVAISIFSFYKPRGITPFAVRA
jgi:hypothetical protein